MNLRFEIGVDLSVIFDLRHRVLRTGKPLDSAHMPGDDAETTQHCGLWDNVGNECAAYTERLIACATLMHESMPESPNLSLRLRGMAVDIDVQNQKFGARMMDYLQSQAIVQESGLWCQARERAVSFYERAGFQVVGEPFDVPKIGEHRGMVWAG